MAGFETVVRPVIFPNIRPSAARTVLPEDDPTRGMAVIDGSGATTATVTESMSSSTSGNKATETRRRVDKVRIRPSGDGGSTRQARAAGDDDGVYLDVEVLKKVWLKTNDEQKRLSRKYAEVRLTDNIEIIESNIMRYSEE